MKRFVIALSVVLLFATAGLGQNLDFSPPGKETVVEISFFPKPTRALREVLEFDIGDLYDQTALRNSIRNIYQLGIYSDIKVNWSKKPGGIALNFRLEEIPVIEGISILGNGPISKRRIIDVTRLTENDRYDLNREEKIVTALSRIYREEGYYAAKITVLTAINLENNNVRLELRIDPGKPTTLRSLELEGFPVYEADRLLSLMTGIATGKQFKESVFRKQVNELDRFYTRENYLAADVRAREIVFDAQENVVDVIMVINAGPLFKTSVTPEKPENRELLGRIPYSDDNVPVEIILANGRKAIETQLQESGHVNADVTMDWSIDDFGTLNVDVQIDSGKEFHVGNFILRGVPQDLRDEILPRLFLSKKGWFSKPAFSRKLLEQDIKRIEKYLREKGYLQARATVVNQPMSGDDTAVKIEIEVSAGPRSYVEKLNFAGNEQIDDETLLKIISVQRGDKYSRSIGADMVQTLADAYDHRGYTDAQIDLRETGEGPGRILNFDIYEGRQATVKKIILAGNDITSRSTIFSALELKEGEPFSQQRVIQSQSNLYRLGNFNRVVIESLNPQLSGSQRRVKVQVIEQDPYAVLFGFGYDTDEAIRFSFGISNENIAGRNIRAGFSTRVSSLQQRYQLSFGLPRVYTFFKDTTMRVFYEEVQREGYDARKKGVVFDTSGYSFFGWELIGRYQYRWIDIFNKSNTEEVNRFEKPVGLHTVSAILTRDTRNDPFEPSSGSFSTIIAQLALDLPGSDATFASTDLQHARYMRVTSGVIAAANVRFGYTEPFAESVVPISERFFLGGSNSVRAFSLDQLGPEYLGDDGRFYPLGGNIFFNSNFELRFPLIVELSGVAFYDNGQVFRRAEDFDFSELEHVLGVGLRLSTPFGPLRLDYGNSMTTNDEQFYITFGHAF